MADKQQFTIQVQDNETGETYTFETNDFMFLSFENGQVEEHMIECAVGHFEPAMRAITEEIKKVIDADKPEKLN